MTHIWDRYGTAHARIPPTNGVTEILALEWDCDGEILAILQAGSGVVQLWDRHSQRVSPVDTNEKALTFLGWSKTGPELAIGSAKGNLYLYDKRTQQIVPIKCAPPAARPRRPCALTGCSRGPPVPPVPALPASHLPVTLPPAPACAQG